ncbi:hypothetical protein GWI33_007228 [Rhynchophorus ferrugineus]|uniref:Uncharacterized protein n=1 Tax=Rhynchophorus ferrugineus TaxID=354439 RepID=A0A834MIH5_RHYFE|nr:hypothetical protein GWI33_007228 [Rhynchophorus ferrugineus]
MDLIRYQDRRNWNRNINETVRRCKGSNTGAETKPKHNCKWIRKRKQTDRRRKWRQNGHGTNLFVYVAETEPKSSQMELQQKRVIPNSEREQNGRGIN